MEAGVMGWSFWPEFLVLYFVPAMIASTRGARNALQIGLLNLFLGWTVIVWIGALIWACTDEKEASEGGLRYPCPFCAEMILRRAKLCPHCRSELPVVAPPPQPPPVAAVAAAPVEKGHAVGLALVVGGVVLAIGATVYFYQQKVPAAPDMQTVGLQWKADTTGETGTLIRQPDPTIARQILFLAGYKCDVVKAAWTVKPYTTTKTEFTKVDCYDGTWLVARAGEQTRVKAWDGILSFE